MAAEGGVRTFDLSVVTPDGAAFEGEAEMVIVPGAAGEIGVLARHAPLVAMLMAGEIRVKAENDWQSFSVIEIDEPRREAEEARAALERADAGDDEIDRWHMEQRLRHAENKIAVAGR
jgi:F-type H+-transporting ATPase subunit epsilon